MSGTLIDGFIKTIEIMSINPFNSTSASGSWPVYIKDCALLALSLLSYPAISPECPSLRLLSSLKAALSRSTSACFQTQQWCLSYYVVTFSSIQIRWWFLFFFFWNTFFSGSLVHTLLILLLTQLLCIFGLCKWLFLVFLTSTLVMP